MDDKQMRNATKAVQAGMKIMYAPETREILQKSVQSAASGDPQALATNVVGVIKMIYEKSQGKMPPEVIPIATVMLVYEFAAFVSEASGEKIPEEQVKQAIQLAMQMLKKVFAEEIAGGKQPAPQQPAPQQQPMPQQGLINQQPQMVA